MRTTLYYYSGRGNSFNAARQIAGRLGDTALVPFVRAIETAPDADAERVGFVFPVIDLGVPAHIPEYLRWAAAANPQRYYFAVVLNGGMPCGVLAQVEKALASVGAKLSAGYLLDVRVLRGMQGDWESSLSEIVAGIRGSTCPPIPRGSLLERLLFTGVGNALARTYVHSQDKKFWTDDNCDGCEACAKLCPVNNIVMENGRPLWQHRCDQCFGCYACCPRQAIHTGKKDDVKLRDHHPELDPEIFAGIPA